MNKLLTALLIIASIVITGCVETRSEYTVNPDGSGKVVQEFTFSAEALGMAQMQVQAQGQAGAQATETIPMLNAQGDPETNLKLSVKKILDTAQGVNAWKDVSFEILPDGRMHFEGTAYFKDISAVKLEAQGMSDNAELQFARQGDQITLRLSSGESSPDAPQTATPEMTDAELNQKVQQAKMQFATMKPMMQGMFSSMKAETVFHLPGPISEASNMTVVDQNTASIEIDGQKLVAAVETLMQDDQYLKEQIRKGQDPLQGGDDDAMNEILFGSKGPVMVTAAADAPQFDYDAEVAEAAANYDAMITRLGLDDIEVPEQPSFEFPTDNNAGQGSGTGASNEFVPFEDTTVLDPADVVVQPGGNVRVGGVRLIRYADFAQGILPLGRTESYTLSLVAQLPSKAVKVTGGVVSRATTNNGQNLLPQYEWDRRVRAPKLAADGQTVVFDIELQLPDEAATALEQVSGTIEYFSAAGTHDVDLGIMDLKQGGQGSALGAQITSVIKDPFQNNPVGVTLELNVRAEQIASVRFMAPDGSALDVRMLTTEQISDVTRVKCVSPDPVPERATVIATVYDQLTPNQFPWDLTRIALDGGPVR